MALILSSFPKFGVVPLFIWPDYSMHHSFAAVITIFVMTSQCSALKGSCGNLFIKLGHFTTFLPFCVRHSCSKLSLFVSLYVLSHLQFCSEAGHGLPSCASGLDSLVELSWSTF
jgi:hypothetical protein